MKRRFIESVGIILALVFAAQVTSAATILITNSSDTLDTFRTNYNTTVTNLNNNIATSTAVATSTNEVAGRLPYFTTNSGTPAKIGQVATTTFSCGTGLTCTGTPGALVGGTNLSVSNTGLLSLAQTYGTAQTGVLTIGTSTDTNILLNITNIAGAFTATPAWTGALAVSRGGLGNATWTTGSIPYYNGSNFAQDNANLFYNSTLHFEGHGTTTPAAIVAINAPAATIPFMVGSTTATNFEIDSSGKTQARDIITGYGGVLSPLKNLAIHIATTTTWTATSSGVFSFHANLPTSGTIRDVRCKTSTGTLTVETLINATALAYLPTASTTNNLNIFSTNNTFVAGDMLHVNVGNPASSPTFVDCTYRFTETP